jgi:hemerythrin-like domain-containing protein
MSVPAAPARDAVLIEPIDPALLREPLEFMLADHYRQRAVLTLLDTLSRGRANSDVRRRVAQAVLAFLRVDLAHHVADEQSDLFPLLRRRLEPGSPLVGVIDQLQAEHAADADTIVRLGAMLGEMAAHPAAQADVRFRVAAGAFVHAQRRHLAWENAVVMPMLRAHLTSSDLRELGRRMAARRGIRGGRSRSSRMSEEGA